MTQVIRNAQVIAGEASKELSKADMTALVNVVIQGEADARENIAKVVRVALSQLVLDGSNDNINKLLVGLNEGSRLHLQALIFDATCYKIASVNHKLITEGKAKMSAGKKLDPEFSSSPEGKAIAADLSRLEDSTLQMVVGKDKEKEKEEISKAQDRTKSSDKMGEIITGADANYERFMGEHKGNFWAWIACKDKEYKDEKKAAAKAKRDADKAEKQKDWGRAEFFAVHKDKLDKQLDKLAADVNGLPPHVVDALKKVLADGLTNSKTQQANEARWAAIGVRNEDEYQEMMAAIAEAKAAKAQDEAGVVPAQEEGQA